jgi:hypothetical protein
MKIQGHMDRLEEFIRKNRADLDIPEPSAGVWKKIKNRNKSIKTGVKGWLAIAASVIIIIGSAVILVNHSHKEQSSAGLQTLKESEIYYNNLVNSLYSEAAPLLSGYPEMQEELTSDINRLDSIFLDIRKDLRDNVSSEEVIEALIQNYRIKVRILEEMLTMLKENEKPEKKKNYEL